MRQRTHRRFFFVAPRRQYAARRNQGPGGDIPRSQQLNEHNYPGGQRHRELI
jgi:hypothetical protein